ncbi:hemogen isoform X1 [Chelonia mydas]|uniref:hemogen isoform X1 n=1 Tax=Chelonia mydas TaxID=8469 RepID=UPI001CA8A629|nr:hemogen isoform X1 [Chelonia mydas]
MQLCQPKPLALPAMLAELHFCQRSSGCVGRGEKHARGGRRGEAGISCTSDSAEGYWPSCVHGRSSLLAEHSSTATLTKRSARGTPRPAPTDSAWQLGASLSFVPGRAVPWFTAPCETLYCSDRERGTSKGPKRGRGAGRRGRQQDTEPEPQPEGQEEVEKEPAEKAQGSPGHHEEEPALSLAQELSGGTQQEAVEGPPAEDTLHPEEHGEAPKSEEAGISEALNISLENDHTDNGYYPSVLF